MTVTTQFTYASDAEAVEDYFDQGFTDGLPVVPPTPERVEAMLAAAGLAPADVLGEVRTRNVIVTAEKVAANAVMAGARPEYFPTVVASVRALLEPIANAHSTTITLAGCSQCLIVNGPVRKEIGVFGGQAAFGPGFRPNATIGRALRLVIRNVLNSVPGILDRASFSTPLRYSFCFAEDEEATSWDPLHVMRGYAADDSVVTLVSVQEMLQAIELEPDPETILDTIAAVTRQRGVVPDRWCGDGRSMVVVLGTEHQKRLLDGGWTKQAIQAYLWERVTAEATGKFDRGSYLARPENVLVVAAGGPGLAVSWVLTPHLSNPVSKVIGAPS